MIFASKFTVGNYYKNRFITWTTEADIPALKPQSQTTHIGSKSVFLTIYHL